MGKRELAIVYNQDMEIISRFPPINSIKSSIQRFKTLIYPVGLLNQSDLDSERFKLLNGPNILLHSNIRTENEKLMILGNPEYIREFTNDNEFSILMDGTFKYHQSILHNCIPSTPYMVDKGFLYCSAF
jgi:hypothetical protein